MKTKTVVTIEPIQKKYMQNLVETNPQQLIPINKIIVKNAVDIPKPYTTDIANRTEDNPSSASK